MARTMIQVQPTAKRGGAVEIRTMIGHPMETGYRPGDDGKVLPRDIIRRFVCRLNGVQVFAADLHQSVAANPYIAFHILATESGKLEFQWDGDNGFSQTETAMLVVSA